MDDYGITKIVDGLFIGDTVVALDVPFLLSNKISHMLAWGVPMQSTDVCFAIQKTATALPRFKHLHQGFQFLSQARDQCLCGFIFAEKQSQAALIALLYFVKMFNWNIRTAKEFLFMRVGDFRIDSTTEEELLVYEQLLEQQEKLKNIQWTSEYLSMYHSDNDDEQLIITTIKNVLNKVNRTEEGRVGQKKRRIQWFDQMHRGVPVSPLKHFSRTSLNAKQLKKTNSLASLLYKPPPFQNEGISLGISSMICKTADLHCRQNAFSSNGIPMMSSAGQNSRVKRVPTPSKEKRLRQSDYIMISAHNFEQDEDYLQLKEMSRTNFNDRKFTHKSQRRFLRKTTKSDSQCESRKSLNNFSSSSSAFLNGLKSLTGMTGPYHNA